MRRVQSWLNSMLAIIITMFSFGCASLSPVMDYAQKELLDAGVDISAKDAVTAIDYIKEAQGMLPIGYDISFLIDVLNNYTNMIVITDPIISIIPSTFLSAGFLWLDALERCMNALSYNLSDVDYTSMLQRHAQAGFNQVLFFLANEGDGSPVPTSFYVDDWFGAVDMNKIAFMKRRIQEAKDAGFQIELWGVADDSKGLTRGTPEQIKSFFELCVLHFGELADTWCVGLEIDEWGKGWWSWVWPGKPDINLISGCVDILQSTGKKVAIHLKSYKSIDLAHKAGADIFNAQFGWLKKPSEMIDKMEWLNARKGKLDIVACEFNRDSITPLATALAQAAYDAGAIGTQTGRPANTKTPVSTVDAIPYDSLNWTSRHRKPDNPELDPDQSLVISKITPTMVYFETTKRGTKYPTEQDGGTINGRVYLFDSSGTGKFFDSIRPNQGWRDFKNIKGFVKIGEKYYMVIIGIDGKWRTPIAERVAE